jgi:HSP90 family molecular chaperone
MKKRNPEQPDYRKKTKEGQEHFDHALKLVKRIREIFIQHKDPMKVLAHSDAKDFKRCVAELGRMLKEGLIEEDDERLELFPGSSMRTNMGIFDESNPYSPRGEKQTLHSPFENMFWDILKRANKELEE